MACAFLCGKKVEVASPSSRIELFGRMWLRTFPRRCGDLWDMYRYVVLPCYGIFMAWPRHAQDSAQIQNLQVLRWSWWMLRFFRARECAPLRRERNCFLDPVLKCAFFSSRGLRKKLTAHPTDVINWHGFGTTSVFAVHCWGSHPGTQKWRKKEASLFEEIEKPFGPRSVEFQLRTEVLRLLWLAEVQRETPSGVPNFFF